MKTFQDYWNELSSENPWENTSDVTMFAFRDMLNDLAEKIDTNKKCHREIIKTFKYQNQTNKALLNRIDNLDKKLNKK